MSEISLRITLMELCFLSRSPLTATQMFAVEYNYAHLFPVVANEPAAAAVQDDRVHYNN